MNKASNANAPAMSPSDAELAPAPTPSGVTEHAPPTVLVTVGLASSAVGLAAEAVSSVTSGATDRAGTAQDPTESGDDEPPYSADEAAWLFGLERVAPVPSSQLSRESEPSSLDAAEPSSTSLSPSGTLGASALSARGPVLVSASHEAPAPMSTPLPMPVPLPTTLADDPSQTSALSAEITAALLPAPDLSALAAPATSAGRSGPSGPSGPSALAAPSDLAGQAALPAPSDQSARDPSGMTQGAAPGGEAALPLAARQTLHLQLLPTPFLAAPDHADADAGAPTGPGVPRDSETTASLQLPAILQQQLRLPPAPDGSGRTTRPGEASLVRRAAGSLLANLGMGLLGGLLALLGAVGFLYLRGDGAARTSTQATTPQAASARPDQARARLLEQATQSLLSGRRNQALASLREYAALSPEPAIEEMIRLLEREP